MLRTPKPCIKFENQVSDWVQPPLYFVLSGELKSSRDPQAIGMARFPAKITNVGLSGYSGKDAGANALTVAADVYINGATALSTVPKLSYISGEAAAYKSTLGYGEDDSDAGIQVAVLGTNTACDIGDVITCSLTAERTANPTTEMKDVVVIVELTPDIPTF